MDFKVRNQKTSPEPAFQLEKTNSPFVANYVFPWKSKDKPRGLGTEFFFGGKMGPGWGGPGGARDTARHGRDTVATRPRGPTRFLRFFFNFFAFFFEFFSRL